MFKAIFSALKDPKKALQIVGGLCAGIVGAFFLIGAFASSFVSGLVGNDLDENFVISESTIYKNIDTTWNKYIKDLEKRMDAEEKLLLDEYAEAGEEVVVSKNINNINYAYVLAYLTQVNNNYKEASSLDEIIYDEDKVMDFFNQISVLYKRTITVEEQMQGMEGIELTEEEIENLKTEVIFYNGIASPEEASEFMSADSKLQNNYIISFYLYVDWLGSESIYTEGLSAFFNAVDYVGNRNLSNISLAVPIYFQQDFTGFYSTGTIATDGCGPTSIAMTFSYLLQKEITPNTIVDWTGDTYAYIEGGSSWSIFEACANHWGVNYQDLGMNTDSVLDELEAGHIIIASMGKGTFTKGGHFIVLAGVTEDNFFIVNDPNKYNYTKYQTCFFDCNLVLNEAKNFWTFY